MYGIHRHQLAAAHETCLLIRGLCCSCLDAHLLTRITLFFCSCFAMAWQWPASFTSLLSTRIHRLQGLVGPLILLPLGA